MSTSLFEKRQHILPCQHIRHYYKETDDDQHEVLHIAINQYIPLDNPNPQPGDVTFIGAHANGVGKELYEPFWDELLKRSKTTGQFRIRSIWIADVSFQGQSGVLNEHKLGKDHSWMDHPRDLLHMINVFRSEMRRPMVGVGHSMGGNNLVNLSLLHPRLLSELILIDPVVQRGVTRLGNFAPAFMSTFRRDIWPSREQAAESMLRNAFYKAWDPRVFDLWIQHGLRDLPTPLYPTYPPDPNNPTSSPPPHPVTLTTTKHDEVFTFLRPNHPASPSTPLDAHNPPHRTHPDVDPRRTDVKPFYRPEPLATFERLPHVRPRVFYVFAEDSPLSAPQMCADKMARTGVGVDGSGGAEQGAVRCVRVQNAGHFVPFEKPAEVAGHVVDWLGPDLQRWSEEEELDRREWEELSLRERRQLSESSIAWMEGMGGPDGGKKKKSKGKSGGEKL